MILRIFIQLWLLTLASAVSASTLTVYAWPLSASSPTPFAEIQLPSTPSDSASIVRKEAVPASRDGEMIRIGLLDSSNIWNGVATAADSFSPGIRHKISLHTDSEGNVAHVGFSSFQAGESGVNGDPTIEIVPIQDGATPVLNKPVVLNPDGKVDAPAEDNRTFLQKYWWAIGIFLLIQVVGGAGGGES